MEQIATNYAIYHVPEGWLRRWLRNKSLLGNRPRLVLPLSTLDPSLSKDLDHVLPLLTQTPSAGRGNEGDPVGVWSVQPGGGVRAQTLHEANFYVIYHYLVFYIFLKLRINPFFSTPNIIQKTNRGKLDYLHK